MLSTTELMIENSRTDSETYSGSLVFTILVAKRLDNKQALGIFTIEGSAWSSQ